jgi:hypothetical protein
VAEALLPGNRRFDEVGIAPDVAINDSPRPCAPAGETSLSLPLEQVTTDGDLTLWAAARIVERARSASREDLLEAARALR